MANKKHDIKKDQGKSQLMPKKPEQKQVKNNDFTGVFFFFKSEQTREGEALGINRFGPAKMRDPLLQLALFEKPTVIF